jgi:hypothetical protein
MTVEKASQSLSIMLILFAPRGVGGFHIGNAFIGIAAGLYNLAVPGWGWLPPKKERL